MKRFRRGLYVALVNKGTEDWENYMTFSQAKEMVLKFRVSIDHFKKEMKA